MKYIFLISIFLLGTRGFAGVEKCKLLTDGCSTNSKCHYGNTLHIKCDGYADGFIKQAEVPKEIRGLMLDAGEFSKPFAIFNNATDSKFTYEDIALPSSRFQEYAQKYKIRMPVDMNRVDFIRSESSVLYTNAWANQVLQKEEPTDGDFVDCTWRDTPVVLQAKCPNAKDRACEGKVSCFQKSSSIRVNATVFCLEKEAGQDCQSASACSNSLMEKSQWEASCAQAKRNPMDQINTLIKNSGKNSGTN